ncbi:MAG: ribose-5-phosphate isomerase RpiA [Gemmatimonadota bacterium]
MANNEELKRAAGYHAAEWIEEGMVVGLGTGSTVRHLLDAIADRRMRGELRGIIGIPTSENTRRRSEALGIPLSDLTRNPRIDLTLDGADEFDPNLDLIKGLGGALLREKLVAIASNRLAILVDDSKRVGRLGEQAPLPVEIDPFGQGIQEPFLHELGCEPRVRTAPDGQPFRTDGGNLILDCYFEGGIPNVREIAAQLDRRTGIFEHGLFLDLADRVVVAAHGGVEVLHRKLENAAS